jgi:hypothetical protein
MIGFQEGNRVVSVGHEISHRTISGARSTLPEPDPNPKNHRCHKATDITGGAVLEYGSTETLPALGDVAAPCASLPTALRVLIPFSLGRVTSAGTA